MRNGFSFGAFLRSLILWVIAALAAALLVESWGIAVAPPAEVETRIMLDDLHVSLGAVAAGLVLLQALVSLFAPRERDPFIGKTLRRLAYASLLLVAVSGAAHMALAGKQIVVFGLPLLAWPAPDANLAATFGEAHRYLSYVLAGVLGVWAVAALASAFIEPAPDDAPPAAVSDLAGIGTRLAQRMRLFGRLGFWLQFLLAFLTVPLLFFAVMGRTVSPDGEGPTESIYWGFASEGLLFVAIALSAYSIRAGRKVAANPAAYLDVKSGLSFGFLGFGVFTGVAGVLISFIGVGMTIALLIGKTVSQPPGIAITDPHKIIRALDVFTLLVNFNLLFAHFLGVGLTVWLSMTALKARHDYVREERDRPPAPAIGAPAEPTSSPEPSP